MIPSSLPENSSILSHDGATKLSNLFPRVLMILKGPHYTSGSLSYDVIVTSTFSLSTTELLSTGV